MSQIEDLDQAIYEIAEDFHSAESVTEIFGTDMLTHLVTHGYVEVDEAITSPTSPFDKRLEGEALLKLTEEGWALERSIFNAA